MTRHDMQRTAPLPVILTLAAQQRPAAPRPWLRATLRTLAHYALAAAGALVMFLLYTHSGG